MSTRRRALERLLTLAARTEPGRWLAKRYVDRAYQGPIGRVIGRQYARVQAGLPADLELLHEVQRAVTGDLDAARHVATIDAAESRTVRW